MKYTIYLPLYVCRILGPEQNDEDFPDRIECVILRFGSALADGGMQLLGEELLMMLQQRQEQDNIPYQISISQGSERISGIHNITSYTDMHGEPVRCLAGRDTSK